jgi:hypothetical protein
MELREPGCEVPGLPENLPVDFIVLPPRAQPHSQQVLELGLESMPCVEGGAASLGGDHTESRGPGKTQHLSP